MIFYIFKRLLYAIPLLLLISFVSFFVITLPPGDYLNEFESQLMTQQNISQEKIKEITDKMREQYGLDQPFLVQYYKWVTGMLVGDFGYSMEYRKPVFDLIWDRLAWTMTIAFSSYFIALFIGTLAGILSAAKQYGFSDYFFAFFSFLGFSVPEFFLALVMMYTLVFWFGVENVGGLFSPDMVMQPWSWLKFLDLLSHIWLPILITGVAGTARTLRVMRANMLDILNQPYIQAARAKGVSYNKIIFTHALKNAIHPIVMLFGMSLPWLIQGSMISSVVLNLPTVGPMFLQALLGQDMYLAGSFLFMIAVFTVMGNILADIILAAVDRRVAYE